MNDVEATAPFEGARVLVVDDEAHVCSSIDRALSLRGYSVDEATSGLEALELLRDNAYDVLILDIRMPGIGGIDVMQRAKELQPHLIVLILTGHASLDSAIAAVKAHAADYLRKPVSLHDLARRIRKLLDERGPMEDEPSEETYLKAGGVALDEKKCRVRVGDQRVWIELTPTETDILGCLMRNQGDVLSCGELANMALGYRVERKEARRLIRPHISRLRQKIEKDSSQPDWIRTVFRRGYVFFADSEYEQ